MMQIVGNGINFDKNDIRENLTLFLYPDDSDKAGNLLRIYQQYFMVSNAAQYIIRECEEKDMTLESSMSMWQSRSMIPIRLWLSGTDPSSRPEADRFQ